MSVCEDKKSRMHKIALLKPLNYAKLFIGHFVWSFKERRKHINFEQILNPFAHFTLNFNRAYDKESYI